jgi:hypothetical protein
VSTLMTVARQLTSSATSVAAVGLRTGLSVATNVTLGARRVVWPDSPGPSTDGDPAPESTAPPVEPEPVVPGPPPPAPEPEPVPVPQPEPATPGMTKRAADVPLKSDPTPASALPPEPEGPDAPAEELGTDGATGLAEPEPLLDEATAKQVAAETGTLRRAAEQH